jgi:hypothetical protein
MRKGATTMEQHEEGTPAAAHARGQFEVKITPQAQDAPPDGEGAALGRFALEKTFHGALVATSRGEMLSAGSPKAGAYVAVERVTGTLDGRRGSFALVHRGVRATHLQELHITVVPESGTGELAGLTGTLGIEIAPDGTHSYALEYTLEK